MGTGTRKKKIRRHEFTMNENLVLKIRSIPVRRRGRPRGNHIAFNPVEKRVRNAHLETIRRQSVSNAFNNLRSSMGIQRKITRHTTVRVAVEMVRSFTRNEIILKMLKKRQEALHKKVVQLLMEQESGWKTKIESDKEGIDTDIDEMMKVEDAFSSRISWINNINSIKTSRPRPRCNTSRTNSAHSTLVPYSKKASRTLQYQNLQETDFSQDGIHSDDICPNDIDSCTNGVLSLLQNCTAEVTVKSEPLDEPATIAMEVEPFEPGDWELFSCGLSTNDRETTEPVQSSESIDNSCKHMNGIAADWVPSYAQKARDWVPSYRHYFARKLAKLKKASLQEFEQTSPDQHDRLPQDEKIDQSPQDEEIDQAPQGQEITQLLKIDINSFKEEADWCVPAQVSPHVSYALRDHNYQRTCHEPTDELLPAHTYDIFSQSPSSPS